jgi:hypothetical protein
MKKVGFRKYPIVPYSMELFHMWYGGIYFPVSKAVHNSDDHPKRTEGPTPLSCTVGQTYPFWSPNVTLSSPAVTFRNRSGFKHYWLEECRVSGSFRHSAVFELLCNNLTLLVT